MNQERWTHCPVCMVKEGTLHHNKCPLLCVKDRELLLKDSQRILVLEEEFYAR